MIYEVAYDGGSVMVQAESDEDALRIAKESWELEGDSAPSLWVSGRWSVD